LAGTGSGGTWALVPSSPLTPTSLTAVTLDHSATATLHYVTGTESAEDAAHGAPTVDLAQGAITVARPGLQNLVNLAVSLVTGGLPGPIAGLVGPVLASLLSDITGQLNQLLSVDGQAQVLVTHHMPAETTTTTSGKPNATTTTGSTATCKPVSGTIPAGHWTGSYQAAITDMYDGSHGINGGGSGTASGNLDLTVTAGGAVTGTFTLSGTFSDQVQVAGGAGNGTGNYSDTGTTITGTAQKPVLQGTFTVAGNVNVTSPITFSTPFTSSDSQATFQMSVDQVTCDHVSGASTGPVEPQAASSVGLVVHGSGSYTLTRVS
jgi:hypothetical protein